jgi:hypothetical protein
MKINGIKILFPVLISYTENDTEVSVFVYLDQFKKDIIIPDTSDINDIELFRKEALKFIETQYKVIKAPEVPKDGFKAIDPQGYKEKM